MDAILGGNALGELPFGAVAQIEQTLAAGDIIELVVEKAKKRDGDSVVARPFGIVVDEVCTDGGTVTGNINETETSASGTFTFTDCIELGVTINGTVSFSASIDAASNWSLTLNGNLTASDSDKTVSLNGLSYNETGNDQSGAYSINTYTYTAEIPNGGFLVQLQAPIAGNESATCPSSGAMLVTGADNTQAKATINLDSTVAIEVNDGSGSFTAITTPAPGSPYPCADFFI
ncbi:MAG: hypothetical protein HKP12_12245 [Gammaproteobacteria bacterium]|nr:hypothetical protein [Gammaproteobacteria bacterium]